MAFANPIVGAGGELVREAIRSNNYVAGTSGWIIRADGTAEFQDVVIRGTLTFVGTYGFGTFGAGTYGGND